MRVNAMAALWFVLAWALLASAQVTPPETELTPCTLLDKDGNVNDGASFAWTLLNLTLDTGQGPDQTGAIASRNISFLLSSSTLDTPARCRGPRHSSKDEDWQSCTVDDDTALPPSVWIVFSSDFLVDNYVQINQTWICRERGARFKMQATGGEGLGWFVCNNDSRAVLEPIPGHCQHVRPSLPEDELIGGALNASNWTVSQDTIQASSIVVVEALDSVPYAA